MWNLLCGNVSLFFKNNIGVKHLWFLFLVLWLKESCYFSQKLQRFGLTQQNETVSLPSLGERLAYNLSDAKRTRLLIVFSRLRKKLILLDFPDILVEIGRCGDFTTISLTCFCMPQGSHFPAVTKFKGFSRVFQGSEPKFKDFF